MSLKTRGILVLVIGTLMGLSLSLGGGVLADRDSSGSDKLTWEQTRLITEVMERVRRDFVEPTDDSELMDSAIRGMVSGLDRHSEFLDAEEYRDIRNSTTGRYSGVGLEVSTQDGAILVIAPIDGTPAQNAGIESGDEIIEINGVSIRNNGLNEAIRKMRGHAGTPVTIRVRRENYDDPLTFHLTRQKIRVASVRYEVLQPSYGYVRLSQFNESTADELSNAIDEMTDAVQEQTGGMLTGLILDLRNNPGRHRGRQDPRITIQARCRDWRHHGRRDRRRTGERRLGIRFGNRRGCTAGSWPGFDHRHDDFRQRSRADCDAAVERARDQTNDIPLLHTIR
jgi:carboxyl-terminal processing protease